jgi:hypothetical protein
MIYRAMRPPRESITRLRAVLKEAVCKKFAGLACTSVLCGVGELHRGGRAIHRAQIPSRS